jgi:integrase
MKQPQENEPQSDWKKVGPCLYRYKGRTYYALLKVRGKQVRQSLETEDLAMARRRLSKKREELEKTDPALARRTLAEHRVLFEKLITGKASTVDNEKRGVRYLVERWPSDAPVILSKITPTHIKAWLKPLREELKPSTVNKFITAARRFFDLAVDDGVIAASPMAAVKYGKPASPVRATPTEDEFRAIVADLRRQTANGHGAQDSADFVELAGTLGLGQAELSGIRRQDIDLEAGVIRIFRRKTSQAFTIPIFPDARPVIERRLADLPVQPEARLLPHDNCKKGLAGACRRLGFPHFEPRALRRFHITRCLRAGIDAPTVAFWQGHRDGGALVLRTYQAEVNMAHSLRMAAMLAPRPENVVEMPVAAAG